MNRNSNALAAAIAATLGAGVAQAATTTVTLTQWATYSNNGSSNGNITSSTATWQYDDVAGTVTQTGGTLNARFTTAPTSTLFRQTTTGLVIGNGGAASATTFSCIEGNFGGGVGASICGNYNFGANFNNNSTLVYSGSSVTRTLGGDDGSIGNPQSLADLNALVTTAGTSIVLTNGVCTLVNPANCTTITGAPNFNKGYRITFQLPVPVAADDTATTHLNTATVINILGNDSNLQDNVTVTLAATDNGGTAVITNNGATASAVCADPCTDTAANIRVKLTPNKPLGTASYTENFSYTVTDATTRSDSAAVAVSVTNALPVANAGSLTILADGAPQGINVATIASNATGDAPATVTATDGTKGTTSVSGTTVTYTLNVGEFAGNDSFTYTITDKDGEQATNTVNVTIQNVGVTANDASLNVSTTGIAPATAATPFDATSGGNVLGDGTATVAVTANPAHGTATVGTGANSKIITYTPNANYYTGPDSFTYSITDSDGETDTGVVTVNVVAASPSLADTSADTTPGTPVDVNLATLLTPGNGSPAQHSFFLGPIVTIANTGNPANGTCEINGTTLTYTPNAGFSGTDTCAVAVEDGDLTPAGATVTINVAEENTFTSTGLREDDGGSSADWLILSLLGGSALLRRRRRSA